MKKGERREAPSADWERARVKRWQQIAAGISLANSKSTVRRHKQFEALYEQLEADVPTPEKA